MTTTTLEKLTEELKIRNIEYHIEYDKARQFALTINIPGHYIEVLESYDDMLIGEDVTTHYHVFRNESHVFTGNDMYDLFFVKMFVELITACME